jgi:cobaltochelatase CobN
VKEKNRGAIIAQAAKMNILKDLKLDPAKLEKDFDTALREIETYLEDVGSAQQPLGLHTLGQNAEDAHLVSNVMQMLGQPLSGNRREAREAFRGDYSSSKRRPTASSRNGVQRVCSPSSPINMRALPRRVANTPPTCARIETKAVISGWRALSTVLRGDPIRNLMRCPPAAICRLRSQPRGDPPPMPPRAMPWKPHRHAQEEHGNTRRSSPSRCGAPRRRVISMLEAQAMVATGVRPTWDEGGATGVEAIPA